MFGNKSTELAPLIDLQFINTRGQDDPAIDQLIAIANEKRAQYDARKSLKQKSNITFKNKEADSKMLEAGDLVLQRQLQVSTGTASKWQPLMTGPFVVDEVQGSNKTAICHDLKSGKKLKTHFSNLQRYRLDESTFRAPPTGQVN